MRICNRMTQLTKMFSARFSSSRMELLLLPLVHRCRVVSERAITMDDIRQLKYMECVVKEALRLFPSVPMFAREISEECNIGK